MSDPRAVAIGLHAEMTRSLIGLSTAVIGFLAVADKVFGLQLPGKTWQFFLALAALMGSTLAGFLVQERLITIAENAEPVSADTTLRRLAQAQQQFFAYGLVFVALWAARPALAGAP